MPNEDKLSSTQRLNLEALNQAVQMHVGGIMVTGKVPNPVDVVETAKIFEAYIAKRNSSDERSR